VEHPCEKCGASVEDGTAFCPRCNFPQIRVAGPEVSAHPSTTPEAAIAHYAAQASPSGFSWFQALPSASSALLAAIFLIIIGTPAGLGMLAAGFLCVVLYRRRYPIIPVTAGMGARLGALTGVLGFGATAIILALWTAFRSGKEIHDVFLTYLQQYAAHSSDPHMQQVLELFNTPEGFTFIMIFSLIMTLLAFLLFSSLGGAIAAFLLHRKDRP